MKKFKITQQDYLKAHRKADREAEIERHGKSAHLRRTVHRSKKTYDRKRDIIRHSKSATIFEDI
jgi:hypothetical protein